MSLNVHSDSFQQGKPIPVKYTGDGDDISPPMSWERAPDTTREFAVICDDPDAHSPQPWVHWVLYKVPAVVTSLPEGIPAGSQIDSPITALQGKNSWTSGRIIGYRGPAPPAGEGQHRYRFTVYALDTVLPLAPDLTKPELLDAMQAHIIARGELIGTYSR